MALNLLDFDKCNLLYRRSEWGFNRSHKQQNQWQKWLESIQFKVLYYEDNWSWVGVLQITLSCTYLSTYRASSVLRKWKQQISVCTSCLQAYLMSSELRWMLSQMQLSWFNLATTLRSSCYLTVQKERTNHKSKGSLSQFQEISEWRRFRRKHVSTHK